MNLRNNCFVSNNFIGIGPIIVHTDETFLPVISQAINNAGTNDDQTTCKFLGLISSNSFENGLLVDGVSCIDYDGFDGECSIVSLKITRPNIPRKD